MGGSARYRLAKKIANAKGRGAPQAEIDELERQRQALIHDERQKKLDEFWDKVQREPAGRYPGKMSRFMMESMNRGYTEAEIFEKNREVTYEMDLDYDDEMRLGDGIRNLLDNRRAERENSVANQSRTRDYSVDEWKELSSREKEWNTNRKGEVQLDFRGQGSVLTDGNERATMTVKSEGGGALDPYENPIFTSDKPETAAKLFVKRNNQKGGSNKYSYRKSGDRILVEINGNPSFWIDSE